jgi:hypothetical protein
MPTKYTNMIDNNGAVIPVEQDRVDRFLSEGWTLQNQPKEEKKVTKSKSSKNKITADAQVTSKEPSKEEENYSMESYGDDPDAVDTLTYSYDDFETAKKED